MNILESKGVNVTIVTMADGKHTFLMDVFDRQKGNVISVLYTIEEANQLLNYMKGELTKVQGAILHPVGQH